MSLRPLLRIAAGDERVVGLAASIRGGDAPTARASAAIRPYLLATLLDAPEGLGDRSALVVAADDIAARDLARDLGAYLAPRRVRYYPSRGIGYVSHLTPAPHLVGLRIAALDALTGWKGGGEPPVVVAGAVALAEAIPDASLRPSGFAVAVGEEVDLTDLAERLVDLGYERAEQVEERGQFAIRGGILDVFAATEDRAARIELFGDEIEGIRWFSTFTQRSLGDAERIELAPAAELALEHRELAEMAIADEHEGGDPVELGAVVPIDRYGAPLDVIGPETAVLLAAADEIPAALRDHWEDVTTAMHDDDARRLYVEVSGPLADRAALELRGVGEDEEASPSRPLFRAQAPTSVARSISEAQSQLEREVRSGYVVAVAFEHRGEAERFRYG